MPKPSPRALDDITFDVSHGRLILTCAPDALAVCGDCPDLHVQVLGVGSAENIRTLAAGLLHLAQHVERDR